MLHDFTIDLHCHPTLKPFGLSFENETTKTHNSTDKRKKHSIWHYNAAGFADTVLQTLIGLTKFSQSNFTALGYGNVRVICASLYSIEEGLVKFNVLGTGGVADWLANMASGIGRKRVNYLQSNDDKFADLTNEYNFLKELDGKVIPFQGDVSRKYVLVKNFNHLLTLLDENEPNTTIQTIYVIITFEGVQNLHSTSIANSTTQQVLSNIQTIKGWEHKPFFITFAHHFYNGFCGHAESLADKLQDVLTNQEPHMNEGMNNAGWEVVDALLDTSNGKRIYIDIKHMSALARKQYIDYLKTKYADEFSAQRLPIIISHGACNGRKSMDQPSYTPGMQLTGARMYAGDINFYDDEIIELAKSGGIIGLQLDERRIGSKAFIKECHKFTLNNKVAMHSNAKLLWNNIQHIVQLLDKNGLFAWDCIALGSDNDGIIDPINKFWTSEEIDDLIQFIERHAYNFLTDTNTQFQVAGNRISAAEVIERIFQSNSMEFFRKYFGDSIMV